MESSIALHFINVEIKRYFSLQYLQVLQKTLSGSNAFDNIHYYATCLGGRDEWGEMIYSPADIKCVLKERLKCYLPT